MRLNRSRLLIVSLAGLLGWLALRVPTPPPASPPPSKPAPTIKPAPVKPAPDPAPPCPSWPQQAGGRSSAKSVAGGTLRPRRPGGGSGKIVEGGYDDGPDGRVAQVSFPVEWWKANITSRGEGCCVFRTWDFIFHWQNIPALWGFPEWLRDKGLPGGGYAENVDQRIAKICQERGVAVPDYINVESRKDYELLKLILATGRMAGVDYSGQDGVHYSTPIAHCVAIIFADDEYVCILDNNFPPDKCLWVPVADFKQRWGGWVMTLCNSRPPAAPWN